MKITYGPPRIDQDGRHGLRVFMDFDFPAHRYLFETHGMSETEITQRSNELRAHHAERARLWKEFEFIRHLRVGSFVVVDCTLVDQGTDLALVIYLADGSGERIEIHEVFRTVFDVPANAVIIQLINDRVAGHTAKMAANADHAARIAKLLGIG